MKPRGAIFWICILAANIATLGLLLYEFIPNLSIGQISIFYGNEIYHEVIFMALALSANVYLFVQIIRCKVAIVNEA